MKKFLIAATALSGLWAFAGSASAADLAAPVDPVYDWSGFYVGATAGYGFGDSRHTQGAATTGDFNIDGMVGGATAGWNFQSDSLVLGLEADISASDIDGSEPVPCGAPGCESDIDWFGTVRARAGYAFDSLLLFASGGLAVGDVQAEVGNGAGGFSGSETQVGWTVGAGAEWGITDRFSVKAEYLFVDLGDFDYGPGGVVDADFDETHIVRAGINFNF